jgi:hypothetical protein
MKISDTCNYGVTARTPKIQKKGSPDTAVKLLPCNHEVMGSSLETTSCRNTEKSCVPKTQSGQILLRTLHKRELCAPGSPLRQSKLALFMVQFEDCFNLF